MLSELSIAPMTCGDAEKISLIEKELYTTPWSRNSLEQAAADEKTLYLTVRAGETLVGYCGLWQSLDEGEITNVTVIPAYRKKGIGKYMLQSLLMRGADRGITVFHLEVRSGNQAAISLYESLGFSALGVRKKFYSRPVEDALLMSRGLPLPEWDE